MTFDWATFGFQIVNVLILLAILRHFLFRPVAAIIAERQARSDRLIADAQATKAEAEKAAAQARAEAAAHASARQTEIAAAQEDAEKLRRAAQQKAREEAAAIVADARREAEAARAAAERDADDRAARLAARIAARLLEAAPVNGQISGYAARLAEALSALPGDRRAAIMSGEDAHLAAPRPLTPEEATDAARALESVGLTVPPVEVDPSLIAGLELRSVNGAVRNSLRSDLDRIVRSLSADDRSA